MADGPITQIADIIVPEVFNPYTISLTKEKSAIISSGALVESEVINSNLAGGGLTFNAPFLHDLDNDVENVSSDEADDDYTGGSNNSTPKKVTAGNHTAVRLSRNQSWSTADLTAALAGKDPADLIADRVASYWARRLQAAFIATCKGVYADNDAAPTGSEHVQGDMSNDLSGLNSGAFQDGVTNFSSEAFLDAAATMGDSMEDLSLVVVHSLVYLRMQKLNLIEFIPDARGEITIPTYLGRRVIKDDGMPNTAGVFDTWLFGAGAAQYGMGSPKVPTETARRPDSSNGGGSEVLYNRVEWCMHPEGYAYVGTPPNGGPSNAATTNNLAHADSWARVFRERKQIRMARLVTREY